MAFPYTVNVVYGDGCTPPWIRRSGVTRLCELSI
jgi:hypothetical protein